MADTTGISTQKISELATTNSPSNDDSLIIDTSSGTRIINYSDLADAILNKLTSKTYTIDGKAQTVLSALTSASSQISNISSKIGGDSSASLANYASVAWSTNCSMKGTNNRNQFIVVVDGLMFTVWIYSSDSTGNLDVRVWADGTKHSGTGSVTVSNITFTRSGSTLSVATSTPCAICIIG